MSIALIAAVLGVVGGVCGGVVVRRRVDDRWGRQIGVAACWSLGLLALVVAVAWATAWRDRDPARIFAVAVPGAVVVLGLSLVAGGA